MAVKQTAGREALGEFAPKFAELNDDVLFGQVWSREDKLSLRERSIVTVVALMAQGLTDSSFQYHLTTAKNNGVTKTDTRGNRHLILFDCLPAAAAITTLPAGKIRVNCLFRDSQPCRNARNYSRKNRAMAFTCCYVFHAAFLIRC